MAGISERVYPKEMDQNGKHNLQKIMYTVFTTRYTVAKDWLKEYFKDSDKKLKILDIACGSGYGTEILSEIGTVTGVDLCADTIEYANKNYKNKNTSFMVGNADDENFLKSLGNFDAIVSLATVEHVEDDVKYMNWIKSSLNPGGASVVCFPSVVTMDWAIPHHKRDISFKAAKKLFQITGFNVKKDYYQHHRLRIKNLFNEFTHKDSEIPVPGIKHWIKYYLTRPHHFLLRFYELAIRGGVYFADQEYLLKPVNQ